MFLKLFFIFTVLMLAQCTQAERDNINDPGSDSYNFGKNDILYDSLYDSRDGKIYKTVSIGQQIWMAENLNYKADDSKCYNDSTAYCDKYGRLYDFGIATEACPEGWRLPSDAEWTTLTNYVGSYNTAAKLKAVFDWDNGSKNTDEFGFSALPGGYGNIDGNFSEVNTHGYWWADLQYHWDADTHSRIMSDSNNTVLRKLDNRTNLYSVRCIKGINNGYNCNEVKYIPKIEFCYDSNIYSLCNKKAYTPAIDICENGIVKRKCEQYNLESEIYNPLTEFCYKNIVYPLCNGEDFDPTTYGCDNGVIRHKCGMDFYDSSTEFCSSYVIYQLCNGEIYDPLKQDCEYGILGTRCGFGYYEPLTEFCSDNEVYPLCNGETYNTASYKCENNVIFKLCGNVWYNMNSEYCVNSKVQDKGILSDARDDKTYKYVVIGTQTWMAENLNYEVDDYKCHNNSTENCENYGKLYNWATAMDINAIYNSSKYTASGKYRGICPDGWHLPSDAEWTTLTNYASSNAGTKLKAANGWGNNNNGTDDYGFSAMPGGGNYFWSYTDNASSAYVRYISGTNVSRSDYSKTNNYAIRCVKD